MVESVRHHNGVSYLEHSCTPIPVAATVSHNGKELKFTGKASVVETRGSWKYGQELHITVHCSPLDVVHNRANPTEWSRIEIALPFNLGVQWLRRGLDSLYDGDGEGVSRQPITKVHEIIT